MPEKEASNEREEIIALQPLFLNKKLARFFLRLFQVFLHGKRDNWTMQQQHPLLLMLPEIITYANQIASKQLLLHFYEHFIILT